MNKLRGTEIVDKEPSVEEPLKMNRASKVKPVLRQPLATQTYSQENQPKKYNSPYSKMNLGVPKASAKPLKEPVFKKLEVLPSLFLKLPEAQPSSPQKVYNIKWFASDNEFKGKEKELTIG